MPELNQAVVLRWVIICLQYGFLLGIYYFLYRIGSAIYSDMACYPVAGSPGGTAGQPPSAAARAYLEVLAADATSGLQPGKRIDLEGTTTIGRSAQHNSIVIQEAFVSSEHALIQAYHDQYWLSDLSSTNGTLLNGGRIEDETLLKTGDEIKIGSVILRFER